MKILDIQKYGNGDFGALNLNCRKWNADDAGSADASGFFGEVLSRFFLAEAKKTLAKTCVRCKDYCDWLKPTAINDKEANCPRL